MPSLTGVRVIRGPDWKWEDQDGGKGNVGTIIEPLEADLNKFGPKSVTVVWDSGYKGQYRAGPKGSYDLRIVDNSATGVKHTNIPCDSVHYSKTEICGILWQCATCQINICTSCFIKEIPHDKSHRKFKRRDGSQNADQISYCWSDDAGPESRIPLLGSYPGAKVVQHTYCSTAQKESNQIGSVLRQDTDEDNILVEWFPSKEQSRYQRCDNNGSVALRAIELGTGGFLNPEAFPLLEIVLATHDNNQLGSLQAAFSIGDWVKIDPEIQIEQLREMQANHGEFKEEMEKLIGTAGRVESLTDSSITVRFKRPRLNLSFNPVLLKKLNEFSINQTICIKDNETTIQEIGIQLGELEKDTNIEQLKNALGRVTEICQEDPQKVCIHFDNEEIHNWLPKSMIFSSSWLKKYEANHPDLEAELVEAISKNVALFFKAVDRGDLRIAKLLHIRHGVDVDTLNSDGQTALHLASEKGHQEVVEWLLNETKVDIEKPSLNGLCAIHCAVKGFEPKILEMLIDKGAQINSQTELGRTAVHLALGYQSKEILRLLIYHGCDVNLQDIEGYTPLHFALHFKTDVDVIKILVDSGKINWKLCTKKGRNVLYALICDVGSNDFRLMRLILQNEDSDLVFKWGAGDFTFLHYACAKQNFQVAKLLLDIQRERDMHLSADSASSSIPSNGHQLKKLLEAPTRKGKTALLVSCYLADYAMIELLINAGADMTSTNLEGNTAMHMLASKLMRGAIPSKEPFSYIAQYMDVMEKEPALSLVAYLIDKGCPWNTINKAGEKASDVLMRKGLFTLSSIEILNQLAKKKETIASGGLYCMGRLGCFQPPVHQLSCPHKISFKACFKCFPLCYNKQKCGCVDEDFVSLPGVKIEIEPPTEEPKQPLGKRKLKPDENGESPKPPRIKRERITM